MNLIDFISDKLNFGTDGSIVAMIAIALVAILLIVVVVKFLKKIIGTTFTIILIIAILLTTGTLSASQLKNYAEGASSVIEQGYPEATEDLGSKILQFFEDSAPEDAGTWVPKK